MNSKACMVVTSIDSEESARRLSKVMVEGNLAACAQIIPNVTSSYKWQGKLEWSKEFLIQFKTSVRNLDAIMDAIRSEHSYQTPEIISFTIDQIDDKYNKWLQTATQQDIS